MYCLTVLEAGSPRSRFGQGWFLLRATRENLSPSFCWFAGNLWHSWLAEGRSQSLTSSSQGILLSAWLCVQMSLFYEVILGQAPINDLFLCLQWPHFQVSSLSEVLGVRTSTYEFGEGNTVQSITPGNFTSRNLAWQSACMCSQRGILEDVWRKQN